jgi:hypothetical protein
MRYAVYITRAEHWSFEERERQPILEAEWIAYATDDAELSVLPEMPCWDLATGKALWQVPVEKTWKWIAHPCGVDLRKPPTFEYNRGGIIVRAPDSALLQKAISVAGALNARVIWDDDQVVGGPGAG